MLSLIYIWLRYLRKVHIYLRPNVRNCPQCTEVPQWLNNYCYWDRSILANIADPDQTAPFQDQSDLGMQCCHCFLQIVLKVNLVSFRIILVSGYGHTIYRVVIAIWAILESEGKQ